MAATREAWLVTSEMPEGATHEQMLEFFGIPPHAAGELEENVRKKRQDWHHKSNSGNPAGRKKADEVKKLIQRLSQVLMRGVPDGAGGGTAAEIPDTVFETIAELWNIVDEYVTFADDYDQALRVIHEAVNRWGMTADVAAVLAWVAATWFNTGGVANPPLLAEGLEAAGIAVREQPGEARSWESQVSLLVAGSRPADAISVLDEAERSLAGRLTASLHMLRARAAISLDRPEDATVAAVRAVHTALKNNDDAPGVRSQATDLLITWLAAKLLPIKSAADLARYVEMVDAAAWCANGTPEAEDQVRTHRMWAANAGKRVFTGSWRLRSFLAVCTGFISLPIHNYVRSAPAWKVFIRGLEQEEPHESFVIVAYPEYVWHAHRMNRPAALSEI
jgi:hypothetical protein